MGTSNEEPMKEVLEALPSEIAAVVLVHSKYWIEEWKGHTASCAIEDLVAANSTCIARTLNTSVQLESLVKDIRANNVDLAK